MNKKRHNETSRNVWKEVWNWETNISRLQSGQFDRWIFFNFRLLQNFTCVWHYWREYSKAELSIFESGEFWSFGGFKFEGNLAGSMLYDFFFFWKIKYIRASVINSWLKQNQTLAKEFTNSFFFFSLFFCSSWFNFKREYNTTET